MVQINNFLSELSNYLSPIFRGILENSDYSYLDLARAGQGIEEEYLPYLNSCLVDEKFQIQISSIRFSDTYEDGVLTIIFRMNIESYFAEFEEGYFPQFYTMLHFQTSMCFPDFSHFFYEKNKLNLDLSHTNGLKLIKKIEDERLHRLIKDIRNQHLLELMNH